MDFGVDGDGPIRPHRVADTSIRNGRDDSGMYYTCIVSVQRLCDASRAIPLEDDVIFPDAPPSGGSNCLQQICRSGLQGVARSPCGLVADHGVQTNEEDAHAGDE
ncbi:hypothetical protein, partial [Pseudothauera rhizosphaerae]|uniref:hypothetical protein n=1 Tax=Pseudothauera rhizosphaerae TaxID=2565932 RepID=UPI001B3B26CF